MLLSHTIWVPSADAAKIMRMPAARPTKPGLGLLLYCAKRPPALPKSTSSTMPANRVCSLGFGNNINVAQGMTELGKLKSNVKGWLAKDLTILVSTSRLHIGKKGQQRRARQHWLIWCNGRPCRVCLTLTNRCFLQCYGACSEMLTQHSLGRRAYLQHQLGGQ